MGTMPSAKWMFQSEFLADNRPFSQTNPDCCVHLLIRDKRVFFKKIVFYFQQTPFFSSSLTCFFSKWDTLYLAT